MSDVGSKSRTISSIYEAAIDGNRLTDFLSAWDEYVLDPRLHASANKKPESIDTASLTEHAKQALEIFQIKKRSGPKEIKAFVEDKKYAAIVTDINGRILETNAPASARFQLSKNEKIFDLKVDGQSQTEFLQSLKRYRENKNLYSNRVLPLRTLQVDGKSALLIAEILQNEQFLDCSETEVIFFKSCIAEWTDLASDLVKKTFGYTKTEIEVLKLLAEGFTSKQISEKRERSQLTIKKQVKALLEKADVRSQSELIRLITGVMHICSKPTEHLDNDLTNWRSGEAFQKLETLKIGESADIQYAHYGARGGTPFLFIQGNSSPIVPRSLVEAVAAADIQIIAPFKPKSGETSPDTDGFSPERHVKNCLQIMRHLNFESIYMAGHCMGGIYALHSALAAKDYVKAAVLVDVGAPIENSETILEMPQTSRRTFLAARETPEVVYAPYAIASDLFFKNDEGKKTIMGITYADSKIDTELMQSKAMAETVERNLTYTLSDPERAVDDLILWMQDWTKLHDDVAEFCPTLFVHGQNHDWLPAQNITDFCASRNNSSYRIIPDAAQLWIYEYPSAFAQGLKAAVIND